MTFPTDWDVNRYKTDYESEEHWELRKAFIEAHKEKFPENELVCLAQVFTNIEFLGCRYPKRTMERVALLSKEIAAKFRELRSGRLKRTFVGASDAASAKAKGRGTKTQATQPNNQSTIQQKTFPSLKSSFRKQEPTASATHDTTNKNDEKKSKKHKMIESDDDIADDQMPRACFSMNPSNPTQNEQPIPQIQKNTAQSNQALRTMKRIPNTGFIIFETFNQISPQSNNILQMSAAKQGATVKCDVEVCQSDALKLECVVRINGTVYGKAQIIGSKKEAKQQAFDEALERARKIHYTIKQKSVHTVSVDVEQNSKEPAENVKTTELNEDNIGFKMMKMLGWTGGALGVSGNGIEQPISIEMKVDRSGLGLSDSNKLNYDFFVDYLTKYKTDESATYDLAFSKEFTKDERKTLHEIANRLGLKSRSHNTTDGSRYIIIFKKLELIDLANEILNNGLRSKCYDLIVPTEPLPEKPFKQQKTNFANRALPSRLQQSKTNQRFGFNYKQQQQKKPNHQQQQKQKQQQQNQRQHPKSNPKKKKFF